MKTYGRVKLDLGSRWSWVVSFLSRPVYARGNHPGRIGGRLGSCAGLDVMLSPPGIKPRPSSPQPVAIPIELSQLSFRSKYYPQHPVLKHSEHELFAQSEIVSAMYM
jgi:hypothetical protein